MHSKLKKVSNHILDLAQGALAHAMRHATYAPMINACWPELSVMQAAHAGELFVKARIAKEHPLLIFEQLPSPPNCDEDTLLDMAALVENGRTYDYAKLPGRLWASTGIRLANEKQFLTFGKLRNCIQHFAVPANCSPADETLRYIFDVLDPFISKEWGIRAIDYNEEFGEHYDHIVDNLVERGFKFVVSVESAASVREALNALGSKVEAGVRRHYEQELATLEEES